MVAFTLALPIIIDLVDHFGITHCVTLCQVPRQTWPRWKTWPKKMGTIWAPWAPQQFIWGLWGTPRTCENMGCSTSSTCFYWDRWKIKAYGVFWFRQRSTKICRRLWNTFTSHKWTSFSMYCGKPIKPSLPLGDALCSVRFTRELTHITYVLSIIYIYNILIHKPTIFHIAGLLFGLPQNLSGLGLLYWHSTGLC